MLTEQDHLVDEQENAWDGWNQKPASVEAEPCEVETHLLSVVVCYEVQRLHLLLVVSSDERKEQPVSVS